MHFCRDVRSQDGKANRKHSRTNDVCAQLLPLAGEYPRTTESDRTCGDPFKRWRASQSVAGNSNTRGAPGPISGNHFEGIRARADLRTLEWVSWVIGGPKGAAAKLGLKRTTLIHKMKKLEIYRPGSQSIEDAAASLPDSARQFTDTVS